MPTAITPLANITLGSNTTTVTFSSIGQGYRDLMLVSNVTTVTSNASLLIRVNADATTTNYFHVYAYGNPPNIFSGSGSPNPTAGGSMYVTQINSTPSTITTLTTSFLDYSATDKHKTALTRSGLTSDGTDMSATRWASNSAITELRLYLYNGVSFAAGSSFALYGVSA